MKILHTADWHIGQFKGPVVDGVNLRSQDTVKCLEYACGLENKMNEDARCRPDWCPLIPFPERHIAPKTATGYEIGYEDGWNECLEKMMRGAKRKDGF